MKTGQITPMQRVLQLPVETRATLLDFLDANTRKLSGAQDDEAQYILQVAALISNDKPQRAF